MSAGFGPYHEFEFICVHCRAFVKEQWSLTGSVKVVRSNYVGGHETVRSLGRIATRSHREVDSVKKELAYSALCLGGNAVLGFHYERRTEQEGNYRFSVFDGSGEAALVEERPHQDGDKEHRTTQSFPLETSCAEYFVGKLPWDAQDQDLRDAFGRVGTVLSASVIRERDTGRSRGFGFVKLKRGANMDERELDQVVVLGRRVRVEPKEDKPKRQDPARRRSGEEQVAPGPAPPDPSRSMEVEPAGKLAPGTWVELAGPDGDGSAVLVCYGAESGALIRKRFAEVELSSSTPWHRGSLGPAVTDQLATASSMVASGLKAGQMFQVVGTPQLVEGLKTGALTLMQTSEGTLGTVVSSSSGQIAGQLRFCSASMAPVLAPMVAWQVLHAIASTSQLCKINRRLDTMQRKLETLQSRQEAAVLGEVRWAVRTLDDILAERATSGAFTQDMIVRLSHVEKSIGSLLERNRSLVDLFRTKASAVHQLRRKAGAVQATALIQEEGRQAVHDMEMLVGLAAAELRVEEARMYLSMEHNPADLKRRLDAVSAKVEDYRELLGSLPSIESLEGHAEECINEMSWWRRNVANRGIAKQARRAADAGLRDVGSPGKTRAQTTAGSYVFWKDESGAVQTRLLPDEGE